ncbi:P-loop containing nucleoside triphosphate hydrolase protein [Obba rivulosa]|uniref:P-loop containing nucleoside triphosphate hydrolase protein n=1 Tax=Obba rivulosa TaxID=1052685 RepID=A0A8E2AWD7_9APHY|nr:P-loop containing nucleoside triphosphate hydrolase protein [Obba rivulosa]
MGQKTKLSRNRSLPIFPAVLGASGAAYRCEDYRKPARAGDDAIYAAWLKSRTVAQASGDHIAPGNHRPFNHTTAQLAHELCKLCFPDILGLFFTLHPWRTALMIILQLIRGMFPAFRGFSHAVLIDELQSMIISGNFLWLRIARFAATEMIRAVLEYFIDYLASSTENIVHTSARFLIEYKQIEQRVRLDIPTLSDPTIRDLLHESDLFVRSFGGGSSFGLFSIFDFTRILVLTSELASHLLMLSSLIWTGKHYSILILSLLSALLPFTISWLRNGQAYSGDFDNPYEVYAIARQERMRNLAYSDAYRPEVLVFGLGPWILQSWARARRAMIGLERRQVADEHKLSDQFWSYTNSAGLFAAMQNLPMILLVQSSSASLGTFTLYRNSIQALFLTARSLVMTLRLAFQGVFLMGAFCAALHIQPKLQPAADKVVRYKRSLRGMKIELKNLSFSYRNDREPVLKDINLTIEAGETLAIVGPNGSGKSTLANVLLRILDYDSGEFTVNGVDIRKYRPADYHSHVTTVFQGFSKYDGSVKENVGMGLIQELHNPVALQTALHLAGAVDFVKALPQGVKSKLNTGGKASGWFHNPPSEYVHARHELSGGEWQRLAISRGFMRAHRPEVELILLDEPTSSLDAHAQNSLFDTVGKISTLPTGERIKTVIFITHRLSTARRADKIAMMERGRIAEFGTHDELLQQDGSYAALYRASV